MNYVGLQQSARFMPITSQVNKGVGIFVNTNQLLSLQTIAYSFYDTANLFGSTPNNILSARVAVIEGMPTFDPATFSVLTDLTGMIVRGDFYIADLGPTALSFPGTIAEMTFDGGTGVTILLSAPVITGIANTLFIGKLFQGGARSNVHSGGGVTSGAAGVPTLVAPAGGGGGFSPGGGSGGGTGGGGYRPPGGRSVL